MPSDREELTASVHLHLPHDFPIHADLLPRPSVANCALNDDVHARPRRGGFDVTLLHAVEDLLDPRCDITTLCITTVVEIDADERVGATEDEPDTVAGHRL